jgi:glycerol-3-phosphate dehydrogenase
MAAQEPDLSQALVPGRPEVMAQVRFAVQHELACRLSDVMIRRTQLFYKDSDQGLGAVEAISQEMGRLLGWDRVRREVEIERYRTEVSRSRQWQTG